MAIDLWIESLSVILGVLYVLFATKEKRIAWVFGIFSSLLAIYLFIQGQLYSESVLYFYYVIAGMYGYWFWGRDDSARKIKVANRPQILKLIVIGIFGSVALGWFFQRNTDADMPYFDATTTVFSFIATWMTARKLLENWVFWVIIDLASIILYGIKGLYLLAGLMFLYTFIAAYGYQEWRKKYQAQIRN